MKKYLLIGFALMTVIFVSAFPLKKVDEKVLRSFQEIFPDAQEVSWGEMPGTYIVNFTEHGIRTRITFHKDGSFAGSYRYYGEQHLPLQLLFSLKRKFPNQKIFGVTEVSSEDAIEYIIKMEDSRRWMTVHMDSIGQTEVLEKLNKIK